MGDPPGSENWIGPFLSGLMLVGFGAGAVAKFAMMLGRREEPEVAEQAQPGSDQGD